MRKLPIAIAAIATLASTSAFAADMAIKAPPPAHAVVYGWTGFYVGANGGYGFSDPTVGFTRNNLAARDAISGAAGGTPPPFATFAADGGPGPRSRNKYSALKLTWRQKAYSKPAPRVQPVSVRDELPIKQFAPAVHKKAEPAAPSPAPADFTASYSTVAFHVVRAGLNWKFN